MGKVIAQIVNNLVRLAIWACIASVILVPAFFALKFYQKMGGEIRIIEPSNEEVHYTEQECCLGLGVELDAASVGDISDAVKIETGRVIIRRAKFEQTEDVCPIVKEAKHLLAPSKTRLLQSWFGLPGRKEMVARLAGKNPHISANISLLKKSSVEIGKELSGCAITMIRGDSATGSASTQTTRQINAIRSNMISVGRVKGKDGKEIGQAEFFCLPQDAQKK